MPLETPARVAAEKLLIITEAMGEAVVNDRFEELSGLLASRQTVLDQLGTMNLDAPAIAVLERVAVSERNLISLIQRTQGEATQDLVKLYSGMKQVRSYRNAAQSNGLLRTG